MAQDIFLRFYKCLNMKLGILSKSVIYTPWVSFLFEVWIEFELFQVWTD